MTEQTPSITWAGWLADVCKDSALAAKLIPDGRSTAAWAPQPEDVRLAWILYNELRTRITTQSLPIGAGDEAAALDSLVKFFRDARAAIVENVGALHASALMVHALNTCIRPFTAKWHVKSLSGELRSLDVRYEFRRELSSLQMTMRALSTALGVIAGDSGSDTSATVSPAGLAPEQPSSGQRQDPVYGVPETGPWKSQIREMNEAEARFIQKRRRVAESDSTPLQNVVGLAISGGGLRSATFALGIVQVLARRGVLKDVDVMSTVSGGGYIGSFISSVLSDHSNDVGLAPGQKPFGEDGTPESAPIRHIRNHSKYLAEGGFSTFAHVAFLVLYGIAMSLLLVAPTVLLAAAIAIYVAGIGGAVSSRLPDGMVLGAMYVGWGGALVSAILLSFVRAPGARSWIERIAVVFFVAALAILFCLAIPRLYAVFAGRSAIYLLLFIPFPLILGTVGIWLGETRYLGRLALMCLAVTGPVFFFFSWVFAVDQLSKLDGWVVVVVVGLAMLYGWLFVNINLTSLHGYYRGRLARTFLRRADGTPPSSRQLLSKTNECAKGPLHLICTALNAPASKSDELRGRDADLFTFSSLYCGGNLTGWRPTSEWEKADTNLDLGTAMAISGAAAAPRMGTLTSVRYTALLALLNVRLGYWLARPGKARGWSSAPGGLYFMREMIGRVHERSNFINLSDGGHIENSGIYELLRRRCKYIVAIDGEADPEHTFAGLLNAIRMANIDLGVTISPDLTDLRDGIEPFKRAHFVMTRITYPAAQGRPASSGLLFVFKLALTGNESELLMRFRQQYPAFPHQSTFQQLFSEAQFEAYRELGQHAADAAFAEVLLGKKSCDGAIDWLACLEGSLLPGP